MKIKVWTLLHQAAPGEPINLATGDYDGGDSKVGSYYCYASQEQLVECLQRMSVLGFIAFNQEQAHAEDKNFWIECVEVEL